MSPVNVAAARSLILSPRLDQPSCTTMQEGAGTALQSGKRVQAHARPAALASAPLRANERRTSATCTRRGVFPPEPREGRA